MDFGKQTIITKGYKRLRDAFQDVGISSRNRIPNDRGVFKFRSKVKYNIYRQSREENEKG
jgi:hypothetical protein